MFLSFRSFFVASCPFTTPIPPGGVAPLPARPLRAGHARSWVSGQSSLEGQSRKRKRPWRLPGTHERLLSAGRVQWDRSLSDRIANSDPFRDRRIFYQSLSGLTRGKIHFFWGKAAFSGRAARKGCHWKLAGRPKGMPLEVGGPPARGRVALPRDRKVCHFQLAGRPKGIPFSSGQTKTDRTPKTSKTWLSECLRTWHARKPACHRPANPRRSALPRHIPGGLGSLVRLGQGASPAKRPGAYPGHQPAHPNWPLATLATGNTYTLATLPATRH